MKKSYSFYWSMGAKIETWGGNFTSATIESVYIDTFFAQAAVQVTTASPNNRNNKSSDYADGR
jgi:hypothetical protein